MTAADSRSPSGSLTPAKTRSLHFFVRGVLAALATELVEFQTLGRGLLVLGRRVVPVFAITAL
jgi:hypothetical protein